MEPDSVTDEYISVVALGVESNHATNSQAFEQGNVLLWRQSKLPRSDLSSPIRMRKVSNTLVIGSEIGHEKLLLLRNWTTKCNELPRNDPRYVSVLKLRQVLERTNGKRFIVEVILHLCPVDQF